VSRIPRLTARQIISALKKAGIAVYMRMLKTIGYVILFLILLNITGTIFPTVSNIAKRTQEINIKTGQVRHTVYLMGTKISEKITDTFISKTLKKEINVAEIESWHIVNSGSLISPGISPHYKFHGAIFQIEKINNFIESNSISDRKKREIAEEILTIWQNSRSYFKVSKYIFELEKENKK